MFASATLHAAPPSFDKLVLAGYRQDSSGVWIQSKNKNNVVTTTILSDAWFDLSERETPKYIQKQVEIRAHINFFAGITEWSVAKQSYKKDGNRVILSLQGEFKHVGQTHYFQEKHIFIAPNIYQIKISSFNLDEVSDEATREVFDAAMTVLK